MQSSASKEGYDIMLHFILTNNSSLYAILKKRFINGSETRCVLYAVNNSFRHIVSLGQSFPTM